MRAIAAGVTDVGRERDHNEDRFVLLPEFAVYVVADGMGGHQCGEVASRMATATIASYFRAEQERQGAGPLMDVLRHSLLAANDRIHARASNSSVHRGMGTTVVAAAFHRQERRLYVAHAGDSRCYCMRHGELRQLTRDHSLVEEALRTRPDITPSELAYLPANVITRALGVEPAVDVELTSSTVQLGDLYLLCSDGLHGFVTDDRIAEILQNGANLTNLCAELVAEANRNGGGDNITAVVVRIEELDEPWASPASGAGRLGPHTVIAPVSSDADPAADTDPNPPDPDATVRLSPPPGEESLKPQPEEARAQPEQAEMEQAGTEQAEQAGAEQAPRRPEQGEESAAEAQATQQAEPRKQTDYNKRAKAKRKRRKRKKRNREAAAAEAARAETRSHEEKARAELEVDDTAQLEPVDDPDAVLRERT